MHPLMQAQALDHLVTDALLQTIVGRPDLADYGPKLAFVKAQAEHYRGSMQAAQVFGSAKALHSLRVDDEQAWQAEESTDIASVVQQILYAMKGKGKGSKGNGKAGGKGANRDGTPFTGDCYHCGEVGHRKFECPTANDGKPDKGSKAKGKGDKGKGKGKGKTLDSATGETGATVPPEDETWWFGST